MSKERATPPKTSPPTARTRPAPDSSRTRPARLRRDYPGCPALSEAPAAMRGCLFFGGGEGKSIRALLVVMEGSAKVHTHRTSGSGY